MSSLKAEHAISDYSELNESDMKVLNEWHDFFSCVVPPPFFLDDFHLTFCPSSKLRLRLAGNGTTLWGKSFLRTRRLRTCRVLGRSGLINVELFLVLWTNVLPSTQRKPDLVSGIATSIGQCTSELDYFQPQYSTSSQRLHVIAAAAPGYNRVLDAARPCEETGDNFEVDCSEGKISF
jgi:hypothetical protein